METDYNVFAVFDGHGPEGHLVSQFLSPLYNKRNDEYGGSDDNRALFLSETLEKIRAKVGKDFISFSDITT